MNRVLFILQKYKYNSKINKSVALIGKKKYTQLKYQPHIYTHTAPLNISK
jgi:hypothetical protein